MYFLCPDLSKLIIDEMFPFFIPVFEMGVYFILNVTFAVQTGHIAIATWGQ